MNKSGSSSTKKHKGDSENENVTVELFHSGHVLKHASARQQLMAEGATMLEFVSSVHVSSSCGLPLGTVCVCVCVCQW